MASAQAFQAFADPIGTSFTWEGDARANSIVDQSMVEMKGTCPHVQVHPFGQVNAQPQLPNLVVHAAIQSSKHMHPVLKLDACRACFQHIAHVHVMRGDRMACLV